MEEGGLVSFLPKACVMVAPPSPSYGAPGRVRVGQLEGQTSTARTSRYSRSGAFSLLPSGHIPHLSAELLREGEAGQPPGGRQLSPRRSWPLASLPQAAGLPPPRVPCPGQMSRLSCQQQSGCQDLHYLSAL